MSLPRLAFCLLFAVACAADPFDVKKTDTFRRIKSHLDAVPAIDTHDHLKPFPILQGTVRTDQGVGMTLFSMWNSSYLTWIQPVTPWPESGRFDDWWPKAKSDFANARATSFYRYQLPAFTDLYHAEGIYGGTEFTRRCLAEALTEKVERGELREDHALRIGTQILPDNALELFPQLKQRLWKHKSKLKPPAK